MQALANQSTLPIGEIWSVFRYVDDAGVYEADGVISIITSVWDRNLPAKGGIHENSDAEHVRSGRWRPREVVEMFGAREPGRSRLPSNGQP
jgi:hypothetical protein